MRLNTYLNYGGNCEEAFRFYERHLGGRITMLMRRVEQPNQPVTWPGWESSIQYASMELGETELMASDVPPEHFQPMRSVYLSLRVDSAAEAERLWTLLSDGGQRADLHAHAGNVLCNPVRAAAGQVRDVLDGPRVEAADTVR
jgi:PhnB protein